MKYLAIICLLFTFTSYAQDDQKRPSWSQGLPERQATVKPEKQRFNPEPKTTSADTPPSISDERTSAPNLEIDLSTEPPVIELNDQPKVSTQAPIITNRAEAQTNYYQPQSQTITIVSNPLLADYSWEILKITPINIPSRLKSSETIKLKIQINPQGKVTRVTSADNNISNMILRYAENSIRSWQFQPPQEIGITENISKIFTIEITPS